MACSLGAMTSSSTTRLGLGLGLSFKDSQLMSRKPTSAPPGRMCSFTLPSSGLSASSKRAALPVVSAKRRESLVAGNSVQKVLPLTFNPLELSTSFGFELGSAKKRSGRRGGPVLASAEDAIPEPVAEGAGKIQETVPEEATGLFTKKSLTTGTFFLLWYFLNVIFNILNKKLYFYFPFPYFVSVVHLFVGVSYCVVSWALGAPKRAPIDRELLILLLPVAACHALGHIMSNVSFAAVAVSFTHTIKALEPFFNAAASQFILGEAIPIKLWLSLAPIVLGVGAASLTELSFNWTGFTSAMIANVAFTYRNIYSKKAMTGMDSTNVYAYISILSLILCIPPALIIEGPALLKYGFSDAVAKVGTQKFLYDLFWVGMFYHLYNQIANNTLERVAPLTHAVGNVLKRVFVIGFTIVVFGNKISTQTGIGTAIAIAGVGVYSVIKADMEEKKRAALKKSSVL